MAYRELNILLPCHSLEDFPTHHDGDDAENLLACWTVLWHPQLIAAAGSTPVWLRVEDPPQEVAGRLIAIPNVSKDRLPTGYGARVKDQGGVLLRNERDRAALLRMALEPLGGANTDPELAADFLALGYAFLQVQVLTRQMRYSSNLDETYFNSQVLEAAQACVAGNLETARERLSACFNLLGEERDRFYPVEAFLLDITMVADTTLGATLREEISRGRSFPSPVNLLLSASLLEELAQREPESLAALQVANSEARLCLLGGEEREQRLPLLALEDIAAGLLEGRASYEQRLGTHPTVFARHRFGLSPALPNVLRRAGFQAAFHATLEDGKFPEGSQIKVNWEGLDGVALPALTRPPLDASQPKTFLQLATKLGESMDTDHVATLVFAHWPGQACFALEDLRRIQKYSGCLGKFLRVDAYFSDTAAPGQIERFGADRYKSPYLKQAVIRKQTDPISSSVRYWKQRLTWDAVQTMHTLRQWITGEQGEPLPQIAAEIRDRFEDGSSLELVSVVSHWYQQTAERLARAICPTIKPSIQGALLLNPYACVRRIPCDRVSLPHLPAPEKPVYATAEIGERNQAVIDPPGHGFAWIASSNKSAPPPRQAQALAEAPNVLRNEFFEAAINPVTGALQSIHSYNSRRNRMSQQLALRQPGPAAKPGETYRDPDETAIYSVMAADRMEVTCANSTCGEITVHGRLLDRQGAAVANYRQRFQAWRGSRVLRNEIELEPLVELKSDPWTSYFAARFAWGEEAVDLSRSLHQQAVETRAKNMEAPLFINVAHVDQHTQVFTGGLPYHRRVGPAMIDSLLITRGETSRSFTLGIGIDVPHPLHEAVTQLVPPALVPLDAAPPASGTSGWLLHVDCRNVITTHVESRFEGARLVGFRARLLEIAGRAANVTLTAMRDVKSARIVNLRGESQHECTVEAGKVKLKMSAYEWTDVEATW